MKSAHLSIFKTILLLTAVSGFFFASMPGALASAGNQIGKALVAAKAWVAQIDAAQYDESYAFGCGAMHDKVPQNRWALVLKTLRTPWGPVLNRNEISHVYKPNGYEGAEGEFMIITYDTSFKRLASATEVIVLKWEDGKWRGAGYNAGAKSSPDDGSTPPPPSNTTEIHTESHVKPQPQ